MALAVQGADSFEAYLWRQFVQLLTKQIHAMAATGCWPVLHYLPGLSGLPAFVCFVWLQEITDLVRQSAGPSNTSSPGAEPAPGVHSPSTAGGLSSGPGSADSGSEAEGEGRQVSVLPGHVLAVLACTTNAARSDLM